MALVVKDRVQETTTTTGTGTLTLGGAVTGFQTFSSAIGNTNTTYYAISSSGSEFEVGIGTVGAGTLARTTILASSNGGLVVNLSAGSKDVFCTQPAEKAVYLNNSNVVDITGSLNVSSTITGGSFVGVFPAGTKMLFIQTTAPTGWTKDTTHDNKALRVVSGSASSGGSVGFTTAFASQAVSGTVGNTTLTTAQMPSHGHGRGTTFTGGAANPGSLFGSGVFYTNSGTGFTADSGGTDATGGSGSHNHGFTGTAINLAVTYVDTIIATKN